uniref:DUF4806 domain-containing protein n=1 Tax=Anopheles minimus TaxID=112268 RepID=A0A182WQH9_9DIPT
MLPSIRDKQTGYIYRLQRKLERKIDKECDAEIKRTTIDLASDSEEERENDTNVTSSTSFFTSLRMTCSDSEDSLEDSADGSSISRTFHTNSQPETADLSNDATLGNECSAREPTITKVVNILTMVSKRVKKMHRATDFIQNEVGTISSRLELVEENMDTSMNALEAIKDVIYSAYESSQNRESESVESNFEFTKISNEEEFIEFDKKLGDDEEYYANVRKWLRMQIVRPDPDKRMHTAMDLVFERTFLPQCSWSGKGGEGTKLAFRIRSNILRLFADIGSNKFVAVSENFVRKFFLKKLPHAKARLLRMKGRRYQLSFERKSPNP